MLISDNGISIIITAWQTQEYIEECLDSVEKQSYFKNNNNFEILVGVDACKKTLKKILQIRHKYRNLRIFMMESNKGTYITSNTLLKLVKYKNIIRFDSDDIMLTDMISEIMREYEKNKNDNKNILIKFGFLKLINNNKNDIKTNEDKLKCADGAVYINKNVYDNLGGYQPWECAADSELIFRGKFLIKEINIFKPLFIRRYHNKSLTQTSTTGLESDLRKQYREKIRKYDIGENIKIIPVTNKYSEY